MASFEPYKEMAIEPLHEKLSHNAAEVKLSAARTLAAFDAHRDDYLTALRNVLKGNDYPWEAAEILGGLGRRARVAVPELSGALQAPDSETKRAAAVALGKVGGDEALAALDQLVADPQQERWLRDVAAKARKGGEASKNEKK